MPPLAKPVDRRAFLAAAGATIAAGLLGSEAFADTDGSVLFAAAYKDRQGAYGVALLSETGKLLQSFPLPARGHDLTADQPRGRVVAFARRPGLFALVVDITGRMPPVTIAAEPGRHFFGHGLFSPDGRLLYATENLFDEPRGVIGIYDASDSFRRIGEFDSGGMDPHEMLLMPDGVTLAVANGGIETHPDFGRAKLNLATMQPSLCFIDRRDGQIVEKHALPSTLHQLSIRHMDIDGDGRVWFGCQYEGAPTDRPQLVGVARPGDAIDLIDMPDDALASLRNYVGSVAANRDAGTVAFSSPQGNSLTVIDTHTRRLIARSDIEEVCGIAADGDGYLATTGTGRVTAPGVGWREEPTCLWDNHILRIG